MDLDKLAHATRCAMAIVIAVPALLLASLADVLFYGELPADEDYEGDRDEYFVADPR